MRILLLVVITLILGICPASAEKSGGVSSRGGKHPRSSGYGSYQNRMGSYNNQHYRYHGSGSNLTYDKGQQWYIDLFSNRNGFYTNTDKYNHKRHYHSRDDYFYNNPNYYYPPYGYTYYYDTGYNRSYYDDRYTDYYGNPDQPVQETYRERNPRPYTQTPPVNYDTGSMNPGNIQGEYDNSGDMNDIEVDTVIYRWTDGDGNDHYTNDKKKVPDEFKDTLVEMESW